MRAVLHRDLGGNHALLGRGAEKAGLSRYHTKQAQSESYTVIMHCQQNWQPKLKPDDEIWTRCNIKFYLISSV